MQWHNENLFPSAAWIRLWIALVLTFIVGVYNYAIWVRWDHPTLNATGVFVFLMVTLWVVREGRAVFLWWQSERVLRQPMRRVCR